MEQLKEHDLISKGKECFERADYRNAQIIFHEAIEINPNATSAHFFLANIFHINGEIGKAIKAFKKVLELDPTHTDSAISLSILYNDIGRYEEAKTVFEKANEKIKRGRGSSGQIDDPHINKKFAFKHFELAEMYSVYNRFDEALFEYNKAIGLDPDNLDARIKVAKVYSKKGFVSKAFEELKKLKNENPGHIPVRIALGLLYYANGNVIEAQNEWQRVLVKDAQNSEALMYLGLSKSATEVSLELKN